LRADLTDARAIAAVWHTLASEPGLRRQVIAGQRRNLARFAPARLLRELAEYLGTLGYAVPVAPAAAESVAAAPYWQVEGPVDSTYSLAIVNRELGLALAARGRDVGFFRPTGTDGGSLDPHWLEKHAPAAVALAERAETRRRQGIAPAVRL